VLFRSDRTCLPSGPCSTEEQHRYQAAVSDAKDARLISIAGFGLAGAALISGGVLWWQGTHGAKTGALTMTPMIGADSAGARLGGRW